jgi:hypothetical protein
MCVFVCVCVKWPLQYTYTHLYIYKRVFLGLYICTYTYIQTHKHKTHIYIYKGHSGASYGETNKASGGELWGLAAHPSKESFATVGDDAMLFVWDFHLEGIYIYIYISFGRYVHM